MKVRHPFQGVGIQFLLLQGHLKVLHAIVQGAIRVKGYEMVVKGAKPLQECQGSLHFLHSTPKDPSGRSTGPPALKCLVSMLTRLVGQHP